VSQADTIKFRPIRLASANAVVSGGPTDGAPGTGSAPHFSMGPTTSSGLPTTGFAFMLKAPSAGAAIAGAGGFLVTCWFRDGVTYRWGSSTSVSVAFNALWICADVDAMDGVIFQIGNVATPGNLDLHFAEQ
jgi:hypothetical protein